MCFFFSRWVLDLVVTSPCPLTTTAKKIPRVWASVTNSVSLCGRQQTPRQFTAPYKTSCPRRYISGSTLTSLVRFVKCYFLWVFPRSITGICTMTGLEMYSLDEIRPEKRLQMVSDAKRYCRQNQSRLAKASDQLTAKTSCAQSLQRKFKQLSLTW